MPRTVGASHSASRADRSVASSKQPAGYLSLEEDIRRAHPDGFPCAYLQDPDWQSLMRLRATASPSDAESGMSVRLGGSLKRKRTTSKEVTDEWYAMLARERAWEEEDDDLPWSVPEGLRDTMDQIDAIVSNIPKQIPQERLDIHDKLRIPTRDAEGLIRSSNLEFLEVEVLKELEVDAAFEALAVAQEGGARMPVHNPYENGGVWQLYSSDLFRKRLLDDIDVIDFESYADQRSIHFRRWERKYFQNYQIGSFHRFTYTGPEKIGGDIRRFSMPWFGSLEPIVVYMTTGRQMKLWFAGNGYMRMQCEMGKGNDTVLVTWSGIQDTKRRNL